jgi:putative SbcD/Mre11-related phosphoesterase
MARVEPLPGEPAAVADLDGERALVVADYHAGIEAALRGEGVEIDSRANERRDNLLALLDRTDPDRLVVLGDLAHHIGEPGGAEREELRGLLAAVPDRVSVLVVKGNHDGEIEGAIDGDVGVTVAVTDPSGVRIGEVGFAHGHTWPAPAVLRADAVCVGHEHPQVRLEDAVGGRRVERAWLRGDLVPGAFEDHVGEDGTAGIDGELVVFPAFSGIPGGTWANVEGQSFLSPFLPEGLADGQAYLLDGTRLGEYRRVS